MTPPQPKKAAAKRSTTEEAFDRHFLRCMTDFPYYAACNLKIQKEDKELAPFVLNDEQKILEEIWADIEKSGRLVRMYILKGRRQGISTWFTGRVFWKITLSGAHNQYAYLVAHDPDTTNFLFEMQKRYYMHLPPEFAPNIKANNAKLLHFQNEQGTGLDSVIRIGTADTKYAGSGQNTHFQHRSELAKWPRENIKSLLTSLDQTMPGLPGTAVLNESTAAGIGGEFHKGFYNCRYVYTIDQDENQVPRWTMRINEDVNELSQYSSIFIPWYVAKKNWMPVPDDFKRTPEEEVWAKKYRLNDQQIMGYRWLLVNKCNNDVGVRAQEYPFNDKEAFQGSGRPSFDVTRVLHFQELCPDPVARYECLLSSGQFIFKEKGDLKVWKEPEPGRSYLISADVAEGLAHGDFHSADVIDHLTGEQVAHYHGKMNVFDYAQLLNCLGKRYNEAWIIPEKNNTGLTVVEELLRVEYPNLYMERIVEPPNKPRKRFGWVTSAKSRQLIIDNLKKEVNGQNPGINCFDTYEEMLNFKKQDDGKEEADPGAFDDRVMSIAIGKYCMKTLPCVVPSTPPAAGLPGSGGKVKKRPSNKAWT